MAQEGRIGGALSVALAWHPQHLAAVLERRRPPQAGDPIVVSDHNVTGRLASIERRLTDISDQLDDVRAIKDRLDKISADLSTVVHRNGGRSG